MAKRFRKDGQMVILCEYCGELFRNSYKHRREENGVMLYRCEYCKRESRFRPFRKVNVQFDFKEALPEYERH